MATKVWFAKEAVVKIDLASNVTITTAAALDTFFGSATAIEGIMKDITITEPLPDVEKLDFHGTDTGGYQNAELEDKPAIMAEISGTLILPGDEVIEKFLYDAGTAISTTHTRYSPGLAAIRPLALLLNLDDSTDECNYAITNARATARETSSTGADGHFETTFTLKCLPRDFKGPEFKD